MQQRLISTVLTSVFLWGSASAAEKPRAAWRCPVELVVDARIQPQSPTFCTVVTSGMRLVEEFARRHGLEKFIRTPIIRRAEVLENRARLEARIRELEHLGPDVHFPPGLTAANDAKDLLLMMPEEESRKYSPKFIEPGFYEKLVAHEMIHLLHIRMVDGKEDDMGPIWFYEGFPVAATGQLASWQWANFRTEFPDVLRDSKRGDYRRYGFMFRQLLKKHTVADLVARARKPDFQIWAQTALSQVEHR